MHMHSHSGLADVLTVGEADLARDIDIDRTHRDVGIAARHAFGNDRDADPGRNQCHRPFLGFRDRHRPAPRRAALEELLLFAMAAVDHRNISEVSGTKSILQGKGMRRRQCRDVALAP